MGAECEGETKMDAFVTKPANGVTWMRDCLLENPEMVKACDRLHENSHTGIRHFSSIRRAVPLEQAGNMEIELSRMEREEDRELDSGCQRKAAEISARASARQPLVS
jgi:hypothetical protein